MNVVPRQHARVRKVTLVLIVLAVPVRLVLHGLSVNRSLARLRCIHREINWLSAQKLVYVIAFKAAVIVFQGLEDKPASALAACPSLRRAVTARATASACRCLTSTSSMLVLETPAMAQH